MSNDNLEDWSLYAKLVLAELQRHSKQLSAIETKLEDFRLANVLQERENKIFREDIARIKVDVILTGNKVTALETVDIADQAVKKYRKYFIGLIFGAAIFLIPNVIKIVELMVKAAN